MLPDVLSELHRATLLIAERGEIGVVLQHIVDAARSFLNAKYAALGVPGKEGGLDAFIHSGISPEVAARMPHLPRGKGLLGALVEEKRPIRIPHIASDPRSVGFPDHHPAMSSFLGVPIIGDGDILGTLYLCEKIGANEFTASDQELAVMFAAHAAVAIQNARLDQDLARLAILEERNRIGMDLHDGIIQSIYAVGLTLESARLSMSESDQETALLVGLAIDGINDTIKDIRNFILDLRPNQYTGDLESSINRLVREFQANSLVDVHLYFPNDTDLAQIPQSIGQTLFLITQNGLANVARHARAQSVRLSIEIKGDGVSLLIEDDGVGFSDEQERFSVGHGLHNMKIRAEQLDGRFDVRSTPGHGTILTVTIPHHL